MVWFSSICVSADLSITAMCTLIISHTKHVHTGFPRSVCVQICQQLPCVHSSSATLSMSIQASPLSKPPSWLTLLTTPERHLSLWTIPAQLKPSSQLTDLSALLEHQSSPAATLLAATGRYSQAPAASCCHSPPIVLYTVSFMHASILIRGHVCTCKHLNQGPGM